VGFGPYWGVVFEGGGLFQEEVSGFRSGRAGEDGVLEGLWMDSAAGACQVWVLVEPGGVGGHLAFRCSHLVDPSRHELSQAHEKVWGESGGVFIV